MAEQLLHVYGEPLSVLLRVIVLKDNKTETKISQRYDRNVTAQTPVAKLLNYYRYVVQGIKGSQRTNSVDIGSGNEILRLSLILGTVQKGQRLSSGESELDIQNGIPRDNEKYPKWLTCEASSGWLAIAGLNGVVIVDSATAVFGDPMFILRRSGVLVALENGMQCIELGSGGHLALYAFGAIVIIPGKGFLNESILYYTCIRPEFLDKNSKERPLPIQPILRVYPGEKSDFYIVQVRQRLTVVKSEWWRILISEHFWQFEFQTFMRFYRVLAFCGLENRNDGSGGQALFYPKDLIIPTKSFEGLERIVPHLVIVQKDYFSIETQLFEINPESGHVLVLGNYDLLPSSVVVPQGSGFKLLLDRKGRTHAFVTTTRALNENRFIVGNEHIRNLSQKNIKLSSSGAVCNILLTFTNGFILMVGADHYN